MRTAVVLFTTLLGYLAVENLIFNTSWYPTIVSPDSSTGQVELFLWNEHKRLKIGPQILTIGDSRMGFFPRFLNSRNQKKFTFGTIAVAGSTPRDWFYMFRAEDPTRRQYSAIVLPVEDYDDAETWENHTNRETDLHYLIAHLRWSDLPEFAGSYTTLPLRSKAALGILLKGSVYRADFQDLLAHRRTRLDYAALARRDSFNWIYDYTAPAYSVAGDRIDFKARTVFVPPGHHADEKQFFEGRLFQAPPPFHGRRTAYLSHWFNKIYDYYQGTGTRIVIFRLPRGPFPPPTPPPYNEYSSVRDLARKPGVILDDEHYFDSLERPELFMDPLHLNGKGEEAFSKMLGQHLEELLSK